MTDFYTYLHCKPNGDPFYVGKGHGCRSHDTNNRNKQHKSIVAKHGVHVFVFPCDSEEQAFADEVQMIAQFRHEGFALANWTNGGEGASGAVRSKETKALMSANLIGNKRFQGKTHTAETRAKQSVAAKGIKKSLSAVAKQVVALRVTAATLEYRAKCSAGAKLQAANTPADVRSARAKEASKVRWAKQKDRTVSSEVRSKISAALKGKPTWNKGLKTAVKNVTAPDQKKMVSECTEFSCNHLIFKE